MDFGTTNSGIAHVEGRVHLLPIDSENPANPHILPTMLYITRGQHRYIGREAVDLYYEQNQGRPTKLRREYVGEIQLTFADLGTFYRDVYVWVDELEPGRLFRSIKSHLQDTSYVGTSIWGTFYTLEDLVAAFLRQAKGRAERILGREIEEIVLGRPVRFGEEPEGDRVAEERLVRAALLAGYERVHLQLEPVAAALSFQQIAGTAQRVLVFDFGGGTLDITVMDLMGPDRHRVLSTGGVRIAGDLFDQRIVRARLGKHLGEEVTYGPKGLGMPAYIFEQLCDWQTLMLLNRPEVLNDLAQIRHQADHAEQVRALESLIRNNYGLMMFDAVEQAKIALSTEEETTIRLSGEDLSIKQPLTRPELERIIWTEARQIAACVDETLAAAGVGHEQIDAVVRTGGSSLIPLFQRMLAARFGRDKVHPVDEFTSVTAGLAISADLVSRGILELPTYSRETVPVQSHRPQR